MPYDSVAISNPILEKVFLPIDPSTTFVSYFGHLNGYDAGYYGYAWADAIAADMATVFEKAKDGYLDKQAGMKLRREIYEPGDSRDVNESIEKFLGRKQSIEPFLKKIGIGTQDKKKAAAGSSQETKKPNLRLRLHCGELDDSIESQLLKSEWARLKNEGKQKLPSTSAANA
jgi:uncharacterized small protein (DUF1192 family)